MSVKIDQVFRQACNEFVCRSARQNGLHTGLVCQAKALDVDEEAKAVTAVISTEDVDRENEVVLLKGLSLTNYRKNPVVLFMHDHRALIGKSLWQKCNDRRSGKCLIAKTQFAVDASELAAEVFALVSGDYMRGTSIGMNPFNVERRVPTAQEIRARPELAEARMLAKSELIEYSFATVPANPEALTTAVGKKMLKATLPIYEPIVRAVTDASPRKVVVRRVGAGAPATVERVAQVKRVQTGVRVTPEVLARHVAYEKARRAGRV